MELRQIQELKLNVPQSRKDFIRLVRSQDQDLDGMLDDLQEEVGIEFDNSVRNNQVQDQDKFTLSLTPIFAAFFVGYRELIQINNAKAAQIQVDDQINQVERFVNRFPGSMTTFTDRAEDYALNVGESLFSRKMLSKYSIGSRITTIEKESVNVVRAIIGVGVANGKSAKEIAFDIDQFIKPAPDGRAVSPFTWVRDYLGRAKVVKIERGIVPAGSVSYNSFRIARTEINNTYRAAVHELHKGLKWVKGYNWNLSPSHPKTDQCDSWAKGGPYTAAEISGFGHPHCMCFETVAFVN